MGQASKIMYTIGRVFNIIQIVFETIMLLVAIITMSLPEEVAKGQTKYTAEQMKAYGIVMLIFAIILIIISIIVFIVAGIAKKAISDGKVNRTPHIIMLVIGIFSRDIFYILGSIFGLISESEEKTE